jgi:CubicO group peptidase (beta-lactamase class C family)
MPPAASVVFPESAWGRIADPTSVGYCAAGLAAVKARAQELHTSAMMIVVGGRILFEYGDVIQVSYLASVRKSVLAMLMGNYVASGTIRLDATLADLHIDDIGGLTEAEKQATVANLLAARSGVYHAAANEGDNLADAPPRGSQKPGTYYLYSNWDFNALGTIFEERTGQSIYDALQCDLAEPLGMQDFHRGMHHRDGDRSKSFHLAYHMHLSTRDMARLGYLMLREGVWKDEQLIPPEWARQIVTPITRVGEMNPARFRTGRFGYGLLWWVWDGPAATGAFEGAYTADGALGQFITVLPRLDMVIAHKVVPATPQRSVSRSQYLSLLDAVVAARCP